MTIKRITKSGKVNPNEYHEKGLKKKNRNKKRRRDSIRMKQLGLN